MFHRSSMVLKASHCFPMFKLTVFACALLTGQLLSQEAGPSVPDSSNPAITYSNGRELQIPFTFTGDYGLQAKVQLLVAHAQQDFSQPQNWRIVQEAPPTANEFTYVAPNDGWYSFSIRLVSGDAVIHQDSVIQKLVVDTSAPNVALSLSRHDRSIQVDCQTTDANPIKSSRYFFMTDAESSWHELEGIPNQASSTFFSSLKAYGTKFVLQRLSSMPRTTA